MPGSSQAPAHCCPSCNCPAQSHNPTEPSEEVRLQLVQLLALILDQAGSAIAAYASEVWSMLTALLVDSFPEVAVQGCRVSQQLAGEVSHLLSHPSAGSALALQRELTCKTQRAQAEPPLHYLPAAVCHAVPR
jgi:hypothetical protein